MNAMQTIPVFFTFDTNYLLGARVAIHSMLRHASREYRYELYVLHTTLRPRNRQSLRDSLREFSHAALHFIDMTRYEEKVKGFEAKSHFSKEIFYKLVAADIFPQYDRIICSDVDVVFVGDFSPVFFMFPGEKFYFAGVGPVDNTTRMPHYRKDFGAAEMEVLEHEIAAGFLLVNLKELRDDRKQEEITAFYVDNYPRLFFPEQDCIVLTCWPYIRYLPMVYNLPNFFYRPDAEPEEFYQGNTEFSGDRAVASSKFREGLAHPVQIHYPGFNKPWNSFRLLRGKDWMEALRHVPEGKRLYLTQLPCNLLKRTRRYSLKRFLRKIHKRMSGQ